MKLLNTVAEQSRRKPPSRLGKGPTPGSWRPGCPSPNPNGRPKLGSAFSDRGRDRIDPDKVLDLAVRVLEDETLPPRERLAIVLPVVDRIFLKPVTQLEDVTPRDTTSLSHVSDERLAAILAELQGDNGLDNRRSSSEIDVAGADTVQPTDEPEAA